MRSREKFSVRGLGTLEAREIAPQTGSTFENLGYLEESTFRDLVETDVIKDETGRVQQVLELTRAVSFETKLKEVSINEINFISQASGKYHAIRYSGMANEAMFQYFCMERAKIDPSVTREFKGAQNLPFNAYALSTDNGLYDIPEVYLAEALARIETSRLSLWVSARLGYNQSTQRVLDISGFARHGVLDSGYASVWQTGTPDRFLRMDGVANCLSFGNILNDDGLSDFVIEVWCCIKGADSSLQEILAKKTSTANSAGFALYRTAGNKIQAIIGSGTASAAVTSSGNVTADAWTLVTVAVDRNGLMKLYINGAADGSASVAAIGSGENALNYYIGRDENNFGQIDIDTVRHHVYGAAGLPSDIDTIAARHFQGERGYYGV